MYLRLALNGESTLAGIISDTLLGVLSLISRISSRSSVVYIGGGEGEGRLLINAVGKRG